MREVIRRVREYDCVYDKDNYFCRLIEMPRGIYIDNQNDQ